MVQGDLVKRFSRFHCTTHGFTTPHLEKRSGKGPFDYECHGMKRRVKEALCINAEENAMNKKWELELNPIWFSLFRNFP